MKKYKITVKLKNPHYIIEANSPTEVYEKMKYVDIDMWMKYSKPKLIKKD